MQTAARLKNIGEYYFSRKLREIDAMNAAGAQVINLGIGSPDLPPHPEVIRALQIGTANPGNHAYQGYKGIPALRHAMAAWYKTWYGVTLNSEREILPLIGSKEGIMHLSMTYLDPGDEVLVPDPGYPTYTAAATLAGAKAVPYKLSADNDWQPDLNALEQSNLSNVKMMWVNYPHMPTGQRALPGLFAALVDFGRKHGILICHDNPYSFILNKDPQSILAVPGALDVAVELNSLSKSHNMAGWRVGMLCGAAERIDAVLRFKSNMDSGMFRPVQEAAVAALSLDENWYVGLNEVYQKRRAHVYALLDQLQCTYDRNAVGMFVWASVPPAYADGYALSDEVLQRSAVFLTPGGIFGDSGKGYIRISLCATEEKFRQALERIVEAKLGTS